MSDEIELISDGDGLAVVGEPAAVDRFLISQGMEGKNLALDRLTGMLHYGSGAADAGSILAANGGRWVQLTEKSVRQINEFGLMKGSQGHLSRGIVQADGGQIKAIVEFSKGYASFFTNPAVLAGAAGIMAQMAMKQSMDEITEYLAVIDAKVDDVLRAQKDAAIAEMIGVGFVLDEAIALREHTGKVSEVTWSKVQATPQTIAKTQAYALRQLDAFAEKLERRGSIGDLAKVSREAEAKVQEWLVILARCFQLQDAVAILELDRVLDADPQGLDKHRLGLKSARQGRLELIARSTERLIARIDAAAGIANVKVVMHPIDSRAVVNASNQVAIGVVEFHKRLGIEQSRESLEATRWLDAVAVVRDDVLVASAEGVNSALRFGNETFDRARSAGDSIAIKLAEQALRRREASDKKRIEG